MPSPTKEELLAQIKEMKANMSKLESANQALTSQLRTEIQDKEGWLVTTPNLLYSGELYDVQFVNGQAFIPKARRFPRFETAPAKERTLVERGFTKEEIAKVRERENRPTAEIAVEKFKNDFGYRVEFFSVDRQDELKATVDARAQERARLIQMQQSDSPRAFAVPGHG